MPNHRRYDVVLLNDNETPMEFVVRVLEVLFDMSSAEACTLMFRAHEKGKRSVVPTRERKLRKR